MNPEFNPEMLILARDSRGHTQSSLARALSINQATISKIESGLMPVSSELLGRLALALKYPQEFFFQHDRVYGFGSSIFYHRKRQGLPNTLLRQLHAQMNIRRNHLRRLLRSTEMEAPCGFRHIDAEEYGGNIRKIAQLIRGAWRLPPGPVRNVIEAIETNGGVVIRYDFGTRKIDAISEWTDDCPPLFFVNSNSDITGDRLRLTLAHEIGHIILHRFFTPNMETEANQFASEFLLPAHEIKPYLSRLNMPKLAALKREWKVSMGALIECALELGTITESQRRHFIINLRRSTHSFREPPETDVPIESPRLMNELIETHLQDLGYSVSEMSKMVAELEPNFRSFYLPNSKVANFR
jgi:Zn-dependent peptidase ImmA (M78 family)/transcriptional regulator with XRE-family HTH domain